MEFLGDLIARLSGPGAFRFILQPAVAGILGIRDGVADARAGRPPYLWGVLFLRTERREMLRQGAVAIAKPFAVAVAIDAVLPYLTQGDIHPGQTLVVATCIVTLPYIVAPALTNRFVSYAHRWQATAPLSNVRSG